ncbi:MEDS domain-containing protein [Blastococcus goldschmidtiae]|uniref:MEDS domain-containing protein n=1 Tax=Blastococcus goldschmidtiae TaxID=3075546 RepID=A0ABU2K588_9ACTN|nr:MEDS domain-containing protein [Blastococcus sp. DSM 46792]MDT0275352.1 MEDS domain-containing protein [Blastococcus sp. DSM 46792]
MRAHGSVTEPPAAHSADHLCWVHDDDEPFGDAVRAFLAGGLVRGERLLCVGDRAIAALEDPSGSLGDVAALLAGGALETMTVAEVSAAAGALGADPQRAFYDAATRRALDDGYRGLRVVAEVTELAADPGLIEELVRWEHAADEFIASGSGMSAMCAYRGDLPPATLGAVLAVHPLRHGPDQLSPFRLFFDDDRLVLTGSVDTFSADRLATLLAGTPAGNTALLDLSGLEFIDVAGCRALAGWAGELQARCVPLEVRGASPLLQRVWHILGLHDVAPVTFTDPRG